MSCFLRTTYGASSEANYRLTRKFTRVGRGAENELIIDAEGLPDSVFLLERTDDPKVYRLRCGASNVVVYQGEALKRGAAVDWRVGEEIDVGGCATLALDSDDEPAARRPSRSSRSGSRESRREQPRTTTVAYEFDELESAPEESRPKKADAADDSKGEKRALDQKTTLEIVVLVVCVAIFGLFFATRGGESSAGFVAPTSVDGFARFLDENEFDESAKSLFSEAYLNEATDPNLANEKYVELQRLVRVKAEEKELDFTKTDAEVARFDGALAFVGDRIQATERRGRQRRR